MHTKLPVEATMLLRLCCWCGRGLYRTAGEWIGRPRYSSGFIRGRQVASSLDVRRWRSRTGRW